MQGSEGVIVNIIRHAPALRDPFGFVEGPVNPEINPALAVLFFRLRESRETSRHIRAHMAGVIFCDSVELVGDEGKTEAIGSVEAAENLEDSAAKSGVTGRIRRERRSKVWALQVAGWRAERLEGYVA